RPPRRAGGRAACPAARARRRSSAARKSPARAAPIAEIGQSPSQSLRRSRRRSTPSSRRENRPSVSSAASIPLAAYTVENTVKPPLRLQRGEPPAVGVPVGVPVEISCHQPVPQEQERRLN